MTTRRRLLLGALHAVDALIVIGAFTVAARIPSWERGPMVTFSELAHMRVELWSVFGFVGLIAVSQAWFYVFGLYQSKRFASPLSEPKAVTQATLAAAATLAVAAALLPLDLATPRFLVIFWLVSTALTLVSRLGMRWLLYALRRRGRNLRLVLIAGTNWRAFALARRLHARPELGYKLLGFVDEPREIPAEFAEHGHGIVSSFDTFAQYLRSHVIDEVVVCLPVRSNYERAAQVIRECREQGIMVRFLSDIFNMPQQDPGHLGEIGDDLFSTVSDGSQPGMARDVKRAIDIAVSLTLLILLLPVAAAVILAIKLTSPGPAHFVQERLGLNKRRFRMVKFRTMGVDAEAQRALLDDLNEVDGPVFKIKNDPRVTWVGRLLRKTSLDELPQLVNVLRGDMSLVGPRPLPIKDYEGFSEDWHRRRFSVRPGITCLWQVTGRNNISFDRWMELDMEYIDRWSLELDFQILAKTIPAVLRGSGAS